MGKNIIVYGENHFVRIEVFYNIEKIIEKYKTSKTNKKIVLSELWYEDIKIFNHHNIICKPLENDKCERINYAKSDYLEIKKSFHKRELSMINHLKEALQDNEDIFIIVGDTHLRTINTKELGIPLFRNFLNELSNTYNVVIHRSNYGEIE